MSSTQSSKPTTYDGPPIQLHPLDEQMAPVYMRVHLIFPPTEVRDIDLRLRDSLSKALLYFPPLVGTIERDKDGKLVDDCQKVRSADFIIESRDGAYADLPGGDDDKLAPRALFFFDEQPLIACKLTKFSCGSSVLATSFQHQVVDLSSFYDFLLTWATLAREGSLNQPRVPQSWLRNPLEAFKDVKPDTVTKLAGYTLLDEAPTEPPAMPPPSSIVEFEFTEASLVKLKALCTPPAGTYVSTADVLTALLWATVVRAHDKVGYSPGAESNIGMATDGRPHAPNGVLANGNYFGNFMIGVDVTQPTKNLLAARDAELAVTALATREALQRQLKPSQIAGKLITLEMTPLNRLHMHCDVLLTNWSKFDLTGSSLDFGWGHPVQVTPGCAKMPPGFITICKTGNGNVNAYVCVLPPAVEHVIKDEYLLKYAEQKYIWE